MKWLFFISVYTISLSVCGQKVNSDFKKLRIGFSFSPDMGNRIFTDDNQDGLFKFTEYRDDYKFGYTTGFSLCYNTNRNWGFEIGIQYANKGYQSSTSDLLYGDYIGGNRIYDTQDPVIETYIGRYNFHYLDVPLRALWIVGEGNLRFVSSIGITSNFLMGVTETSILELENGNRPRHTFVRSDEYKSFGLSPTLSLGLDYHLGEMFQLRVEPTFRYGLIESGDPRYFSNFHEHLISAGLNFTCYYTLK